MGRDDTASIDTHGHNERDPVATRSHSDGVQPGEMLGVYKLLERIGEGGFGAVYLAEQTEPVRRRVAIKLLKFGYDAEHILARFNAERQTLAMMDHPNIAKILDAGRTQEGVSYFVMEYVQGSPITDYCDATRLTIRERIGLIRGVCHAVTHAHQKGIIHRDIKPSNVLVGLRDDKPVPKVIDFGIAKVAVAASGEDSAAYTRIHQMLGTPAYMSPEQAGGAAHATDTRTDVYSIGALLYELLVGVTPLDSNLVSELPILELHAMIANEPAPSTVDRLTEIGERAEEVALARSTTLSNLKSTVRGDLNWIVQKCLEKDPLRRYPTVSALEEDLRRYLANEPVVAGPPSQLYLLKKFVRRRRVEVSAGVLVFLILMLGFGGTVIGWAKAEEESTRLQFTLDFFTRALAGVTEEASPIAVWSENPDLTLGEALAQSQGLIGDTFAKQPELEATIRQLIGLAQLRGGKFDDAEYQLAQAYQLRSGEIGPQDPRTIELLLPLAEARFKKGDALLALEPAKQAYEMYAQIYTADSEIARSVALWIARRLSSAFRFADAELYFEKAISSVAGTADTVDPITLAAMIERVADYVSEGMLAKSELQLRSIEPKLNQISGQDAKLRRIFTTKISQLLVLRGKYAEAIRYLTPPPGTDPKQVDRVNQRLLAWAVGKSGDFDRSDKLFKEILEAERQHPGTPFLEIFARLYYADILLDHGRAREAADEANKAIVKYDALDFPNDPDRLWGKAIEGAAYVELGLLDEAQSALDDTAEIRTLFPEHKLHLPSVLWAQARLARARGNEAEAQEFMREAISRAIEIYGSDHEETKAMQKWRDSV